MARWTSYRFTVPQRVQRKCTNVWPRIGGTGDQRGKYIVSYKGQRNGENIWDAQDASGGRFDYRPEEFGLGLDAREMFAAFAALFDALGSIPTTSEFRKLLADALAHARTEEHLRHCIFGWMEQVDRARLFSPALSPLVHEAVMAMNRHLGMDHIEIG